MADDRRGHVRVDASKALAVLARTPGAIGKRTTQALQASGREFQAELTKGITERLHSRTGTLRRAPGYEVTGEGIKQSLRVFMSGVDPRIVRAQEYGGTFRSKRPGGKLTIPIDDNLTAAGVPKITAREAISLGAFFLSIKGASRGEQAARQRSARKLALGRVRQFKGAGYIVKREPNGELKFLFRLVDSVTLKPRLGFRDTWKRLAPARTQRLREAIALGVQDAGGSRG